MASIDDLLKELDDSVIGFNKSLNIIQSGVLAQVELLIKDIKVSNGTIVQDVENLKKLNELKQILNKVVIPKEYKQRVIEFGKSFNTVTKIQNEYFTSLLGEYTAPAIINEVKNLVISETTAALTQQGLNVAVTDKIGLLIQNSITTGDKYTNLVKELRLFVIGDKERLGAYEKLAAQITTDAINTYAANYNKLVSEDLGLEWFIYAGALVTDSREICVKLVHKKYIHISEFPEIIKGVVDGEKVPIYKKTGLPYGMIEGTNVENLQSRRGGRRCNHQYMPILTSRVPVEIRNRIKKTAKATANV